MQYQMIVEVFGFEADQYRGLDETELEQLETVQGSVEWRPDQGPHIIEDDGDSVRIYRRIRREV